MGGYKRYNPITRRWHRLRPHITGSFYVLLLVTLLYRSVPTIYTHANHILGWPGAGLSVLVGCGMYMVIMEAVLQTSRKPWLLTLLADVLPVAYALALVAFGIVGARARKQPTPEMLFSEAMFEFLLAATIIWFSLTSSGSRLSWLRSPKL